MEHRFKAILPVNYSIEDASYFDCRDYNILNLKIKKLRNAIITYDGICLIDYKLVKESVHGYRDRMIINNLSSKLSLLNNDTFLIDDSNRYLLIHGPIKSFYNWLTESIPRILLVKSQIKNLVLLLPVSLKKDDFISNSLIPFAFKDVLYIPQNCNLKIKHLILPQIKPFFSSYDPQVVKEVRKLFLEYSQNQSTYNERYFDRIFLINKKDVSNINELHSHLSQLNFHYVNIRSYTFYDLVRVINHAKIVVFASFDDLGCLNFLRKGASILEFIRKYNTNLIGSDSRYLNLASCLEVKYYYQLCKTSGGWKSNTKLKVDLETFQENFNLIGNS